MIPIIDSENKLVGQYTKALEIHRPGTLLVDLSEADSNGHPEAVEAATQIPQILLTILIEHGVIIIQLSEKVPESFWQLPGVLKRD